MSCINEDIRHYDSIGLFQPSKIGENQYRYYSHDQIHLLKQILFFRELGIGLEIIKDIVQSGRIQNKETVKEIFLKQEELIKAEIKQKEILLNKVSHYMKILENEYNPLSMYASKISIKELPALNVIGSRRKLFINELASFTEETEKHLEQKPIGLPIYQYYNEDFDPEFVDVEVLFPVAEKSEKVIPASKVASIICTDEKDIASAYEILYTWVQDQGFTYIDVPREIHYVAPDPTNEEKPFVIEIQLPIE